MPPPDFDFSTSMDRPAWSSTKWARYRGTDTIPLWIADMDFRVAPAIQAAVADHVAAGDLGYMTPPAQLAAQLAADHEHRYGWRIDPDWIVWLPGLVLGINLAVKACCAPEEQAMAFSPSYPPFLAAPELQGRRLAEVPLRRLPGSAPAYTFDFAAMEAAMARCDALADRAEHGDQRDAGPIRLLLLCHPHNPIGRQWDPAELDRLAAFCEQHDLYVCSDEVHADLLLEEGARHQPFAQVMARRSPTLARRVVTLHGPGKTFNIAGLGIAWALIPDAALRRQFRAGMQKLVPDPCCLGFTALAAALSQGEPWRQALLPHLRANRDRVSAALQRMGLPHTRPQVSYLTWIDARSLARQVGNPLAFFERHGVGLSDGTDFGSPGFLRLNFAAPAALLETALARMEAAIASLPAPLDPPQADTAALPA